MDLALPGNRLCMPQHRRGEVGKQNIQRRTDAFNGAERDQTFSGADVGEPHPWGKLGCVKHVIGVTFNVCAHALGNCRVIAVPDMQQPLGPHIGWPAGCIAHLGVSLICGALRWPRVPRSAPYFALQSSRMSSVTEGCGSIVFPALKNRGEPLQVIGARPARDDNGLRLR